jgi:outer membrane protein TolC
MIHRLIYIPIALALFTSVSAQKIMSLEDCIQYAHANHPEIALAQLEIRDADWQIRENTATAMPHFNAGVNYLYYLKQPAIPADAFGFSADPGTKLTFALKNSLTGTVGVNQLLFSRSYLVGVRAAREYRNYVDLNLEAAKARLRNSVRDAYMPALLVDENIEIIDRNIEVQQKLFRETQEVFKAGFAEQLDVDRLQYILGTLSIQRDNLVRQREILIDVLQFAMDMPVQEEIELADDLTELLDEYTSLNPDQKLDYTQRADYVALLKVRELNEFQVELYRKTWLPNLSGFAEYRPSYQGNDKLFWIPSAVVGLQLNIPIYDGGFAKAKRERAIVAALKVDVQKETMEHAFDLEIETARKQYANARTRLENEQRNLDLAQKIYDTSQTKFSAGVGSSVEVTQAQAGLYQSQSTFIQARYDLLQAYVALKKALGQ